MLKREVDVAVATQLRKVKSDFCAYAKDRISRGMAD